MPANHDGAPVALIRKLDEKLSRFGDLESQLNDPAVLSNSQRLIAISKEKGQLDSVVGKYREYRKAAESVGELKQMAANKADPDMAALAEAEIPQAASKATELLESLKD